MRIDGRTRCRSLPPAAIFLLGWAWFVPDKGTPSASTTRPSLSFYDLAGHSSRGATELWWPRQRLTRTYASCIAVLSGNQVAPSSMADHGADVLQIMRM